LIVSMETFDGQDADPPATPVTIHLVRHGETDWNVEGRLQGWTDIPLNATGIEQAHAAASVLAGRPIGSVLSSDLSRARDTAAMIAAAAGREVLTDPALRERNYGVAEGRLFRSSTAKRMVLSTHAGTILLRFRGGASPVAMPTYASERSSRRCWSHRRRRRSWSFLTAVRCTSRGVSGRAAAQVELRQRRDHDRGDVVSVGDDTGV
jgi:hypothetical protein